MSIISRWIGVAGVVWLTLAALAAGAVEPADCLSCHSGAEFVEESVAEVLAALSDPGIPPHARFMTLTEAQVKELLEALREDMQ